MDREERAVICTCAINASAHNSALRLATAFSKGTPTQGEHGAQLKHTSTWTLQKQKHTNSCWVLIPVFLSSSEGTVDIGHLPHPVLIHLRSFFDLWDDFILQGIQTGQPYISDHLMFEVRLQASHPDHLI